jgi:hypothetical protein
MAKFDKKLIDSPENMKKFFGALDKQARPEVISNILQDRSLDSNTKFAVLRFAIQNYMIPEVVQPMHIMSTPLASFGAKLKPEQLTLIAQDCLELIRTADPRDRDKHESALANMLTVVDLLKNVHERDISKMVATLSPEDQKDLFLMVGSRCLAASMVGDDGRYTADFVYMDSPTGFIGKFVGAYKDVNLDVILGDDIKPLDRQFAIAFTALAACQNNKLDPERINIDFAENADKTYQNRDKTKSYTDLKNCGELLDIMQNPREQSSIASDIVNKICELAKNFMENIKNGIYKFTERVSQSRAEDNAPGRS